MNDTNKMFLRRLEEMWDKDKLYEFVSEQVNWMYEDLQSPDEIKESFLKTFHDELMHIADSMAGPYEEFRRAIIYNTRPILRVKNCPEHLEGIGIPGKMMPLPEGAETSWPDWEKIKEAMPANIESIKNEWMKFIEEYEREQKSINTTASRVHGHHGGLPEEEGRDELPSL